MRAQLVRAAPAQASTAPRSWHQTVGDYVSLTKPRIIILLLITTIPAMILAADGLPSPWLMGAALAAGRSQPAAAAMLFYVFVHTLWLKRSTPQNIVIGGAAGAMPPVIGWAAVTNAGVETWPAGGRSPGNPLGPPTARKVNGMGSRHD